MQAKAVVCSLQLDLEQLHYLVPMVASAADIVADVKVHRHRCYHSRCKHPKKKSKNYDFSKN